MITREQYDAKGGRNYYHKNLKMLNKMIEENEENAGHGEVSEEYADELV